MRMVQPPVHQITDVITMGHGLMPAAGTVHMIRVMPAVRGRNRCAGIRIGVGHFNHMLVDMILVHVVQMPVMQIIDMVPVAHCRMAAARAMDMVMIGVLWV